MSGVFDQVDLGLLPTPQVIEPLDYETILAAMLADLRARLPEFDALVESDPAMKILEVAAYRELILRARVNDAARAVLLAHATGTDLDHLAALFDVGRRVVDPGNPTALPPEPPVLETDTSLRRRVQLALEAATAAGTAGRYLFYALGAAPMVADASVTSPLPGVVLIAVLSAVGDGTADASLLNAVAQVVQDPEVRQLCDTVTVQSATITPYDVVATLYYRPGAVAEVARTAAIARLTDLTSQPARLGRDIARSAIFAALHVEGVARVDLVDPVADLVIPPTAAATVGTITITDGGVID